MLISKGGYGEGKPKNLNPESVQKAYTPVRVCKLPGFMQRRVGPTIGICNLVPRPPPFLPFVCVHNTRERKTGEKRGKPGSIDHVSRREVDAGGGADIQIYTS